ncbi:FG-GAP-like repeat-containing protein [Streptomyces sp. NPDC006997]|uniref:FG-GAP-like repeat-containing protein n=1 Tax=Streptomyces sp. NPDC006997 TaxID=3155356 RepID=UPI0033DCFD3E
MKRRAWLTLGAVVLGGGGVATYALASPSDGPDAAAHGREKRPVEVYDLALKGTGKQERELPRTSTEQFSLLGVSWTGPRVQVDGTAQVRTRSSETGEWTGWQDLELGVDPPEGVEPGMRGASEPLWVGPSDGVEVQVVRDDGTASAGLPKGLEVNLVDPGVVTTAETKSIGTEIEPAAFAAETASPSATESAAGTVAETTGTAESTESTGTSTESATATATDTASPDGSTSASPTDTASASPSPTETVPTAPPSTVTQPPITSRAGWGADESMVEDPPSYLDKVQAVFVHHTVGSNSYSCAQSASLVRGIMAYHVQVNGWNDLGYNFLVDKCGQIFEGRAGGTDLPVMGAHTYGFNTYSAGIAVLGDFQGDPANGIPAARPTRATLESVARVAAWKLGQYGGDPTGKVTLTAGGDTGVWDKGEEATLNQISGHRDGYATECPGATMYAKLGEIRRFAASAGANSAIPTSDFNRDGVNDLVAGLPKSNRVTLVPGGTDGPVAELKRTISQGSPGVPGGSESGDSFGTDSAWGDYNADGYADLMIGAPGEDDTSGHADRGAVTVLYGPGLDRGFSFSSSSGITASGARLGSTVTSGDFNADGRADVFTAGTGHGGSYQIRLAGGTMVAGKLTSASGSISALDAATGDFNRDGYADVALNYRDNGGIGRVVRFAGSANGLTKVGVLSVKGGRSITAGDFNGNGYDDIAIGQPYTSESGAFEGGQVTMLFGTSSGFTTSGMRVLHQDTSGVPGGAEPGDGMGFSVSAGDYDDDGYADLLVGVPNEDITRSGTNRSNAGMVILLKGSSSGLTGSGGRAFHQDASGISGVTETNDKLGTAVVLQDLSGWGRADLAIGARGEDDYDGVILQLDSGSSGIDVSGHRYYSRSDLGTPSGGNLGAILMP